MKRIENSFFSFKSLSFKSVLPIKIVVLLLIVSLSFVSCQEEREIVIPKETKRFEKVTSNQNIPVLACPTSIDSIGIVHNLVIERYRQLFNIYLFDNNVDRTTISESEIREVFTIASLQISIERCSSQDTVSLRPYIESLYDIGGTHENHMDYIINNSSDELADNIQRLSILRNKSDIVSLNNSVQSFTTISLEEKREFTVISSTYQNSLEFWSLSPDFGGVTPSVIDLPEYLMIDAASAMWFYQNYGYWGPEVTAAYGAYCSARAAI